MAIGDIYYDKTVLILRGDSFTDLSIKKNKVIANGSAAITTGHNTNTQTGSAILCGTVTNAMPPNTVNILGNTLDDIGTGDWTIEIAVYTNTFNSVFSTMLSWGLRETNTAIKSFVIDYTANTLALQYINGTTITSQTTPSVTNQFATGQWIYLTIIRSAGVLKVYKGTTLLVTDSTNTTSTALNTTSKTLQLFAAGNAGNYNYGGVSAYCGGLRITRAARPAPSATTFSLFQTYAGQISGNITESLAFTSWTITGISPSGLSCSTVTTGSSYTLDCPSLEPYTITCSPTIDGKWEVTKPILLNTYYTPSDPATNAVLYKCTTAGTTSSTEPAFTGTTYTDGTVVWTKVDTLIDPISLGARIPS
jgi:hypothetical protein